MKQCERVVLFIMNGNEVHRSIYSDLTSTNKLNCTTLLYYSKITCTASYQTKLN